MKSLTPSALKRIIASLWSCHNSWAIDLNPSTFIFSFLFLGLQAHNATGYSNCQDGIFAFLPLFLINYICSSDISSFSLSNFVKTRFSSFCKIERRSRCRLKTRAKKFSYLLVVASRSLAPTRARSVAVNTPPCHGGDRRFEPGRARHEKDPGSCEWGLFRGSQDRSNLSAVLTLGNLIIVNDVITHAFPG